MEQVLDLGCGSGDSWRKCSARPENWQVIGVDPVESFLQAAREKYSGRGWTYVCGRGEELPLADASVEGALCWLSLPYTNIPKALADLHRVIVPGGWLLAALHPPGFTLREFWKHFPQPKQSLFRVFVLLNGMVLHASGDVLTLEHRAESCQTRRGMRIAVRRAGFLEPSFRREGPRFIMETRRDQTPHERPRRVLEEAVA